MSRHHWMYFGCQCSSARCRRLLLERLTLFGIFSAEIMTPRSERTWTSGALPIELRSSLLAVRLQSALFADGIRPLKDPVLPRRQAAEDFCFQRFRAGETQVRFKARH